MWKIPKSKSNENSSKTLILRTVNNDYDLCLIKSILEDNGIPYLINNHG